MNVALEMSKSPFLLADGAEQKTVEILRAGGWRKFVLFSRGRQTGVCMGEASGAAARFARMGFRFYPAGTWEASDTASPGLLPEIKPDVLNVIHGTAQAEMGAA